MNPIQAKNGYLIFKTGSINIPINYEYHYLSVNLTKTEQTFANLIKQAEEYGTIAQIQYLTEKLDREMNGIRIIKRNKRGLINIIGTAYKYLFGTLDQNDKEELEQKIYDLSQHSIQINELNEVIEVVNRGIEVINHLSAISEGDRRLELLVFNLQQFTEYIEDIELGMQLTRLGIFNPKLLRHDPLSHVNSEKLLNIKTSTWLKSDANEILIISHIPRDIIKTALFNIVPYPDKDNNILIENVNDKYYIQDNQVYKQNSGKPIINKCITGILNQIPTECRYSKTHNNIGITYVEPNIILTWKLSKIVLNQNCIINREIIIEGDNIIKAFNCSVQIENILITSTTLDYTQTVYINNNVTKLEPLSYLNAKEIIKEHTNTYNTLQIITLTILAIIILTLILYFIYKYKGIPKKLIVKYKKENPQQIEQQNNTTTENINTVLDTNPVLYPRISA